MYNQTKQKLTLILLLSTFMTHFKCVNTHVTPTQTYPHINIHLKSLLQDGLEEVRKIEGLNMHNT